MSEYDFLIVGAGLFGATFAREMTDRGRRCLVVERRSHTGGNVWCDTMDGIPIHFYGAHIFHTDSRRVWEYVNRFARFNGFINSPIANFHGELYNLPFNMNTFYRLFGVRTPAEAAAKIASERDELKGEPKNLEEQAISLVGRSIYEKLVKGYTEKQWGRACKDLPAFIIRRLPVRLTFDNNYYQDPWQGIAEGGYCGLIAALLSGVETRLGVDFLKNREALTSLAEKVVYTGAIDEFFGYEYGALDYRGLEFRTERLETANYQGVAVMNFTDDATPYTRIIEHKHFARESSALLDMPVTYITREYPTDWKVGDEAYYPVNDARNQALYEEYAARGKESGLIFGGRLGLYRYMDMDDAIGMALDLAGSIP